MVHIDFTFSNILLGFGYHVLYCLLHCKISQSNGKNNLKIALPNLNDKERLVIEKKFYKHFCDMFMEMAKTMTISAEEMDKRFKITNIELMKDYEAKGKSIMLLIGTSINSLKTFVLNTKPKWFLQIKAFR